MLAIVFAGTSLGDSKAEDVDFQKRIAPILSARCVGCHQPGKTKGGLDLTSASAAMKGGDSGPSWTIGNSSDSEIVARITPEEPGAKADMPRQGEALTAAEIVLISKWIDQGARWPESLVLKEKSKADAATWWSLQKLADVDPPEMPADFPSNWAANPIDAFIATGLAREGLKPNAEADKRTLLRRATFDLTGLPPTPEEMQTFLADPRPDAFERQVDKLLASPRYGERWGRYWLDVVRFGESNGFERNVLIDNAWPFRDYVIRSLNQDKPFGQMIREHLAGDAVSPDFPPDKIGVAFLTVGPYDDVGNQDPVQAAQIRANTVDDMIVATGSAFLGLTIGCARCHDHKFDPIAQSDYFKLQSAFAGVRQGAQTLATPSMISLRNRLTKPLDERRAATKARLAALEKRFQERVARQSPNDLKNWPKPVVSPQGASEPFPEKPILRIRLTILNNDRDPNSAVDARIDELELWTREPQSRNVALVDEGTRIEAPSRKPGDFGDAYAPELMIDGKYGAAWISPATPAVITITLPKRTPLAEMKFSSDRTGAITGRSPYNVFVGDYILEISQDGETWETIADASQERPAVSEAHQQARRSRAGYDSEEAAERDLLNGQLAEIDRETAAVPNFPSAWLGNFSQPPEATHVQIGGDPQKKGEKISPGSLSYLSHVIPGFELSPDAPEALRRESLADWIAAPTNPLTWRVLANRIWYLHFGTGLVETPGDFGYMGGKPSHPELLDWLASRLIVEQGRWKPLHRLIMTSQAYRQSSAARPEPMSKDSGSRNLWRYPPRRLEGEQIRDAMLATAGVLDETRGGPGFRLFQYLQDNVATYVSLDDPGPETWRRTVYHQAPRAARIDYLTDFDCPDNAQSAPSRVATVTPLQSMTQWNHRFTLRMAEKLADRVSGVAKPHERVDRMYVLVYQRHATEAERAEGAALAEQAGWTNLARVLLNSNEFLYVE
jgi:mono/diheme cytochrome c family protein